jgi:hypothetical protein
MKRAIHLLTLTTFCASPFWPVVAQAPVDRSGTEPQNLLSDVARLDQASNSARLEALQSLLQERSLPFEVHAFANERTDRDPRTQGRNVVVTLGSGAREIVVGAHYDAVQLRDGTLSSGMVDNGAGAVVLVHVAEALRQRNLRHTLRVVLFDMEEIGLVGSARYAESTDHGRVAAMVNLDIAAYGNTLMFGPSSDEAAGALHQAVRQVCVRQFYECIAFPNLPPSDNLSFQRAGIPSVALSVLPRVEAHQMWLLVNSGPDSGLREGFFPAIARTIHTPDDTIDKLDADGMTLAYNALINVILELDGSLP